MPEKPLVFISCGQHTQEEIDLGNEVERLIRDETSYEPYFAEQQNTLDGLVTNILSALGRTVAFIGIMHHRGSITTPSRRNIIRGSVWVEQEVAIASFIQLVLKRQIEVVLYLQRGISREGIRSQLLLRPMEFDSPTEVISDLRKRVGAWNLSPSLAAPLTARWAWKLQPGYTGDHHDYKLFIELRNNSPSLIEKWQVDVWFPSKYVANSDFEHMSVSDIDFSMNEKRIWPGRSLHVLTISYFVNTNNWPDWYRDEPKVRIKVSTANAPPWEEEILVKDIQKF